MIEDQKSILFIIDTMGLGGAQKAILNYIDKFHNAGYVVGIFSLKNIVLHEIPSFCDFFTGIEKEEKLTTNIFTLLDELKKAVTSYTIVFGFMDFFANYVAAIIATIDKKRLFLSSRNQVSKMIDDHQMVNINRALVTYTYNCAEKIICPSQSVADDLINNFSIDKDKTEVIYNTVSDNGSDQGTFDIFFKEFFEKPVVLFAGRLSSQKNLPNLIRAFRIVIDKGVDASLLILGEGEEEDRLKTIMTELSLEQNVHFVGYKENVLLFLKRSSLFVLPSYYEGLPNALMEAMACSIPVAGSFIEPVKELIEDNVSGRLFDPDNPDMIADVIIDVLSNSRKAKEFTKKAKDKIDRIQNQKSLVGIIEE